MKKLSILLVLCVATLSSYASDILTLPDSMKISTLQDWENIARPQILKFFQEEVYGKIPPRPKSLEFKLIESSRDALEGMAERRQYQIISTDTKGSNTFTLLLYLPKNVKGKIPTFLCANFWGNHTIVDDPNVIEPKKRIVQKHPFPRKEAKRGCRPERIPVRDIVARGYAIATFYYCEIYPDLRTDTSNESLYMIFDESARDQKLAIAAWAWGYQRARDLLEALPEIDQDRVAIVGHSRLAKTSIYAAAHDKRFYLLCANGGGVKSLRFLPNLRFKFWFSQNLKKYVENEKAGIAHEDILKQLPEKTLPPFDQYSLLACVAPRGIYIPTSDGDVYATPINNFTAVKAVEPVFALYGKKDFAPDDKINSPVPHFGAVAYHCKKGVHSITREDWKNFLDYADFLRKNKFN